MVKSLIITGFGINCEIEMAAAYRLAGAIADIAHVNDVLSGKVSIQDYDVLNFPGGFSFGDDLGSGKVMANKLKYKKVEGEKTLLTEIKTFLRDGKFILGICNGFQFLVRLGLLPNTKLTWEQEASLAQNESGKFEDRWVYCKVNPCNKSPFLQGIDVIPLPVRHGEGKLVVKNRTVLKFILDNNLHAMSYADEKGNEVMDYPANPNGSVNAIAALTDKSGQVLGMMPHPEAFLSRYNHPDWAGRKRRKTQETETGLVFFENIVRHLGER